MMLLNISFLLSLIAWFQPDETQKPFRLDESITHCDFTTQTFADMANDPNFLKAHLDPVPSNQSLKGEMITFPVTDGKEANGYMVYAKNPTNDYMLVIHEWYGLNQYVKTESDNFAEKFDGMNILAIDLYDGGLATNSDEARTLMQAVQTERALAIIKAAGKLAGEKANIFTVGWCFGGGWSLQASIEMGSRAKGAVMFYGMPEQNMDRLKTLQCDVLGIFAKQDGWITPEVAEKFKTSMSNLDNELVLKSYDANHGFANPSNPVYDKTASAAAYKEMSDFISKRR